MAISALVGTIIGVGMFELPYAASQAGVGIALFYLLVFGIVTTFVHLLYLEVVMRTKGKHRLIGYVRVYLGKKWEIVTFIQGLISLWGTLLIYTILTGKFFYLLLQRGIGLSLPYNTEIFLGAAFFIISAAIVLKGKRAINEQELWFSLPLGALIVGIFIKALTSPSFAIESFVSPRSFSWILPYGVTLFALSGSSIIPSLKEIIDPKTEKGKRLNIPLVVVLGTLIPTVLYMLFVIGVIGVSKGATSPDALAGLEPFFGKTIIFLGAALGIIAIYTSFLPVAEELYRTFVDDYHKKKSIAALFTFLVPLFFYVFQVFDFTLLISVVGTLMGGYLGILVVLLFWKMQKKEQANFPISPLISSVIGLFIISVFIFASLYVLVSTMTR